MSLLREWDGDRPIPQWRRRVVVKPTGRIKSSPGARHPIGSSAQAPTRGGMLVLHHGVTDYG